MGIFDERQFARHRYAADVSRPVPAARTRNWAQRACVPSCVSAHHFWTRVGLSRWACPDLQHKRLLPPCHATVINLHKLPAISFRPGPIAGTRLMTESCEESDCCHSSGDAGDPVLCMTAEHSQTG